MWFHIITNSTFVLVTVLISAECSGVILQMLNIDPSKMQMCSFEHLVYFNVDGYMLNADTRL